MVHLMRAGRVMPLLPGKTERTRKSKTNKKSEERPHRTLRRRVFLAIIIHKMLDERVRRVLLPFFGLSEIRC